MDCCNDNIELGSPGSDGAAGISSYTYIAFADNVVAGTPDVVTNFSVNTPDPTSEWMAIINSSTPLAPPVEADFEDAWIKIVGEDGVGSTGINLKVNNVAVTGSPFTTLDFIGSGLSGITGTNAGGGEADIEIVTATLIKTTRTDILSAIALNGLVPGVTYWITDVGDGADDPSQESGIILRAIAENKLALDGVYVAKVVDRSVVTQLYDAYTSITSGDYVEAFNEVYRLDTVAAPTNYTTHPADDPANFTFMSKDTASIYKIELQTCKYDLENDIIRSREDSRGNKLTNVGLIGSTGNEFIQQCFRWGVDAIVNNNITCYQDVDGWSSNRMPDFSSWYQDYSSVSTFFYGNTIEAGVVFKNTDFEAITEVYGCTFKCPMIGVVTNINFNTSTAGVSPTMSLINSTFINTIIDNCPSLTITDSKFTRCTLDDVTDTTFTEDDFIDCVFSTINLTTFNNNVMNDSALGVVANEISNSLIYQNKGSCDMQNLSNCHIGLNDFAAYSNITTSYIKNGYYFKYAANFSTGVLLLGDTPYSGLTGDNAVFNGFSLCAFSMVRTTIDCSFTMYNIRINRTITPIVTDAQLFTDIVITGGTTTSINNIIFNHTFLFQDITLKSPGYISNFIINNIAAATGTSGAALPADFKLSTTIWKGWSINTPIDNNNITTHPYNLVSAGTTVGNNYSIEHAQINGNGIINKLITTTESNIIGFLDMDDTSIFSGTTLTIPLGMQFVGKYYLYNANSTDIITDIVNAVNTTTGPEIVKEFRVLHVGAGTDSVTFRPTTKASATATTFTHTSTSDILVSSISDVVVIKRSGTNLNIATSTLEIVQTSIKA